MSLSNLNCVLFSNLLDFKKNIILVLLTNPLSETFFFHKKYFNIKSKAIIQ